MYMQRQSQDMHDLKIIFNYKHIFAIFYDTSIVKSENKRHNFFFLGGWGVGLQVPPPCQVQTALLFIYFLSMRSMYFRCSYTT